MEANITKRKNRQYNEATLKSAIENVLQSNMSLYRASKEFGVPWTTLKKNVQRVKEERDKGIMQITMSKIGRPFSLTVDLEQRLLSYIIQMQEIGFGLTVNKIRQIAYSLVKTENIEHSFSADKECAGWNWWVSYKNRYGLALRTPENLSAGRATCSNPAVIADFYEKLQLTLVEHNLSESPERIWNCDETGLMFVNKPNKIVTKVGKKYIYNRTYAEKGTTTTVLACINAAGCFIPPLVIFKGVRHVADLTTGCMPNSMTRLSPKGWINADLFLEWLKFFVKNIPPARPVLLVMDSHASHIAPQVLDYAKSHLIVLFTMPAHTSHILQPLDVGVFRPLKVAWRSEVERYKINHPSLIPTRYDFHKLLTPAYERSFTPTNIRAGFEKSGIYPLNKNAVPPEAIAPAMFTDKPDSTEQILIEEDFELAIPQAEITKTYNDPLNETQETQKQGCECHESPNITHISNISGSEIAATQNMSPPETLQMECSSHQVPVATTSSTNILHASNTTAPNVSGIIIHDILHLPKYTPKVTTRSKRTVPKAQCLTPIMTSGNINQIKIISKAECTPNTVFASTSTSLTPITASTSRDENDALNSKENTTQNTKQNTKRNTKRKAASQTNSIRVKKNSRYKQKKTHKTPKLSCPDDDWICYSCNGLFSNDVLSQNGADWITCSFCMQPYHIYCQSQEVDESEHVFMCDNCSIHDSSDE